MSMGSLGRLGIEIYADTAQFTGALGKADTAARSWAQSQAQQFKSVEYAVLGVAAGVGATVASLVAMAHEQVKMAARLDDMAEKTGATVESLSAMANVARVSGQDLGALEGAMAKLAKGIAGTDEEAKGAAGALKYLGISARDAQGNLKDTGTLTGEIAKAMTGYADGTGKAALAQALFGKSGAELLPFLKDLATSGDSVVKVTAAQAAAAENYEKSLKRLTLAKEDLVRTVAMEAVPVLTTMAEMLLKSKTAADGTLASAQKLAADGSIREWAEKGAYSIAFMVDSANALKTVIQAAGVAIAGDIRLAAELANLVGNINNPLAAVAAAKNMVTIYKDTEDQLQRVLAGHKSIRFELDAQLAKAREVDALVAKYADPKYKDARDLRRAPQADFKAPPVVTGMKHEAEAYLAVLDKIFAHESGLAGSYQKDLDALYNGFKRNKLSTEDYVRAVNALIQQQPFVSKAAAEQNKAFDDAFDAVERERLAIESRIRSARLMAEGMEFEVSLLGLSNTEREIAIKLRELENSGIVKGTDAYEKFAARIRAAVEGGEGFRQQMQRQGDLLRAWDSLGESAGRFFSDLVTNGKDAFSRLRDSLKSFAADLLALFAKKLVLNILGQGSLADAAGAGSVAGSLLSGGGLVANLGGMAAGAAGALGLPGVGNFIGGLTGSIAGPALPGSALAMGQGAAGIIGTTMPYLAAIAAAYALIKKFGDKGENPKAQLGFGAGADAYVTQGVFGAEGFKSIQTDDAFNQSLRAYFASFKGMDEALAKMLNDSQQQRIRDALGSMNQREFAFPRGDGTAGEQLSVEYLKQKYGVIFDELDSKFAEFVRSFTGSAADLQKAIADEAAALEMLDSAAVSDMFKAIPDLTIEGLRKIQQAGEALSDTFTRVVNEFMTAQNNLNNAIASRNPQFARDLVLGQRNNVGVQFAQSLGMQYGPELAAQMALNPQSFTGLSTNQMTLLAQWLGLQTQLEQLDAQLAATGNAAGNVATSFNNAADAAAQYAAQLLDSQNTLAGFLRGSITGPQSPLSAQAKYEEARRQLEQQFALAESGNLDARAGLGGFLSQFWELSRATQGSSGQGVNDYWTYYNRAAGLTGGQVQPYTRQDGVANTQAVVAAMATVAEKTEVVASATIALANMLAEHGLEITSPTLLAKLDEIRAGNLATATGGVLA